MGKPERQEHESMRDLFDRHFRPRARSDAEWLSMRTRIADAADRKGSAPRWHWYAIPAVAGVAIVLVAIWLVRLSPPGETPGSDATAARLNWEQSIFFPPEMTGASQSGDEAFYPEDMRAISMLALWISAEGA